MDIIATTVNRIVGQAARGEVGKFTDIVGGRAIEVMKAIRALPNPSIESIKAIDEDLWDYNWFIVKARVEKKLEEQRGRYQQTAANRALYLPSFTLTCAAKQKDGTPYWRFDSDLESAGLAVLIERDAGKDVSHPVAMQMANELPFELDKNGRPTQRRVPIHPMEYGFLREEGYRVSKASVVWHWETVRETMCSIFPQAVEFTAYNHRLRAPLLPGGFMKNQRISCVTVMTSDAGAEWQNPTSTEVDLLNIEQPVRTQAGVDGSGVYDPEHPQMAELVARYGKVVFQLSVIDKKTGLFCKGIIVPREGACAEYGVDTGIILDHGQVKGRRKKVHGEALGTDGVIAYDDVYVGIMKAWDKPGTMGAGFEQLENISQNVPNYVVAPVTGKDLTTETTPWRITTRMLEVLDIENAEDVMARLERATARERARLRHPFTEEDWRRYNAMDYTDIRNIHKDIPGFRTVRVNELDLASTLVDQWYRAAQAYYHERDGARDFTVRELNPRHTTAAIKSPLVDPVIQKLLNYREHLPPVVKKALKDGDIVDCVSGFEEFRSTVVCVIKRGDNKFLLLRPHNVKLANKQPVAIRLPGGLKHGNAIDGIAAMLRSLTNDYLEHLMKGGADKLIAQVAKEDPYAKLIVDFATVAKAHDINFNLMAIDMIRSAVEDRKQRRLWVAAQGAGIEGEQLVIVMDKNVRPGHIVTRNVQVGQVGACWRFPTILACGLLTLVGQEPLRHMLVDNEVPPNVAFMNPVDVLKMQGDDDGDIIACTTEPRVVELWQNRLDNNFYAIEPKGEKLTWDTDSDEGWKYSQQDPMGPVGILTILRSMLLAVGDEEGALAMSVMIQEAIDSAKRKVRWTDWRLAAEKTNWVKIGEGRYTIHVDGVTNNYLDNPDLTIDELMGEIFEWADERMNSFGCLRNDKVRQYPIAWKIQQRRVEDGKGFRLVPVKKRVVVATWKPCNAKSNGYEGGNWVHYVHDVAYHGWMKFEESFMGNDRVNTQLNRLLTDVLSAVGLEVEPEEMTYEQYEAMCDRMGLNAFGERMKKIMQAGHDDSDRRNREIAAATALLHNDLQKNSTLQDLVNVWNWETTPRWKYRYNTRAEWKITNNPLEAEGLRLPDHCGPYPINKVQRAFRAVTHPASEVMAVLGIKPEKHCDFLTKPTPKGTVILDALMNILMDPARTPNPYESLANTVYMDRRHARERTDANGVGIEMHECEHCRETLQTSLVRHIRDGRQVRETAVMRELIQRMREKPRTWKPNSEADIAYGRNTTTDAFNDSFAYNPDEWL